VITHTQCPIRFKHITTQCPVTDRHFSLIHHTVSALCTQPVACLHSHSSRCHVTHTITCILMRVFIALQVEFSAAISKRIAVAACIVNINMTSVQKCNNISLDYPRRITRNTLQLVVLNVHRSSKIRQLLELKSYGF
jgi:hypothetical protein